MLTLPSLNKPDDVPEPEHVGKVAGELGKLIPLAKLDPEAFKKKLMEHWEKMEKE